MARFCGRLLVVVRKLIPSGSPGSSFEQGNQFLAWWAAAPQGGFYWLVQPGLFASRSGCAVKMQWLLDLAELSRHFKDGTS